MREKAMTIYPHEVARVDDTLQVFCGYFQGNLRFGGRGGRDIRRNHPAYRRIHGVMGPSPTLMAGQIDYNIAYYEE